MKIKIFYAVIYLFIFELSVNAIPKKPSLLKEEVSARLSRRSDYLRKNRKLNRPSKLNRQSVSGTRRYLVVLIKAKDKSVLYGPTDFDNLLFSNKTRATGSLKDYYTEVSNGKLNVEGDVFGFYTSSQNYTYYTNGESGFGNYPKNAVKLIEEAIDAADSSGVDFSKYDNDGDGEVDGVFIVHQGAGAEAVSVSDEGNYIWSHKWDIESGGGTARTYDGVKINEYIIMPETNTSSGLIEIGVFCHEFGHLLGLPDLYDTDYSSSGNGVFDLMSSGGWGGDSEHPETPTHLSVWSKYYLDWANIYEYPKVAGGMILQPVEGSNEVIKIYVEGSTSEYFMFSNRQKTGFDKDLPGEGLLIWHIDEVKIDSKMSGGALNDNEHSQSIALMEADGNFNLQKGPSSGGNDGEAGDYFPGTTGNTSFTPESVPSSDKNNGENSGISIVNIKLSSSLMNFTVGIIPPPSSFKAIAIDGKIALKWKNPEVSTFYRTFIRKNTVSYPVNVTDGSQVYEGTDSTFSDTEIAFGQIYYYTAISQDTAGSYSEPDDGSRALAAVTLKAFNYPNPVYSGQTTIRYQLENTSVEVVLYIYDIAGELVLKIENMLHNVNNTQPVPDIPVYDYSWDGKNGKGNNVASGVYIFIIEAKDNIPRKDRTGKILVIK